MITIIDYGLGNIRSVEKSFLRLNIPCKITNNSNDILKSDKLLLPGVGHFEKGVKSLKSSGLFDVLDEAVKIKKIPILGICLGMQLMTNYSEEGNCEGFGWINGETKKFNFSTRDLKIPHIGWNNLKIINKNSIIDSIGENDYFYFVHSYYITCEEKCIIANSNYGLNFVSLFNKDNIYGCQFHPEKSHNIGLKFLYNFVSNPICSDRE